MGYDQSKRMDLAHSVQLEALEAKVSRLQEQVTKAFVEIERLREEMAKQK